MLYCSQFIKHDRRRPDYLAVTKAVKEKSIDHHISEAGSMNLKVRSPYALLDACIIRFSYAVGLQAFKSQNETSCAVLWFSYFCCIDAHTHKDKNRQGINYLLIHRTE